ncbi:MAG: TIGR03862 family flavoprotein [Alsobacter sp.]
MSARASHLPPHHRVAIIGGGPAGLMAAQTLATLRPDAAITVYDHMPSLGRKLLMAGRGGLNLTHAEPLEAFLGRYGEARARLAPLVEAFAPETLRAWAEGLGQETFVGTSGRVFPRAMKASPLLRAWLRRLEQLGVRTALRRRWTGWDGEGRLLFAGPDGVEAVAADATLLALGGGSWPRLGSDGGWAAILAGLGVRISPLEPANSGFTVDWSEHFRSRFAGQPIKGAAYAAGGRRLKGEAVATARGIEGGAVYALSRDLREALAREGSATLLVDLRPDAPAEGLAARIAGAKPGQSLSSVLRKALGLSPAAAGLLREAYGAALPRDPGGLAAAAKAVPLRLSGTTGLDRAISTAGGVAWEEVDDALMLKRRPGLFLAGEMLDWEAPTGGYLLQACFATGAAAGRGMAGWLKSHAAI